MMMVILNDKQKVEYVRLVLPLNFNFDSIWRRTQVTFTVNRSIHSPIASLNKVSQKMLMRIIFFVKCLKNKSD